MSQSSQGHSNYAANASQASSQALLDELRVAADRARDERLKLARMFKHTQTLPVSSGSPEPAVGDARVAGLSEQVERLEQAVAEKLEALDHAQKDIDSRTQYLESLRHTITDTTRAFVTQVEQAQHFKAHVDAAKQHVRMSAGKVVEQVRRHLAESEAPIKDRIQELNTLDQQIDKRIARMQQMHKQAGDAVDKHLLAALRSAKEQAAELAEPMKQEVDIYLSTHRAKLEEAINTKISELDVDVEEALSPLTTKFEQIVTDAQAQADLLADTVPDRIETIVAEQLDAVSKTFVDKAKDITEGIDSKTMDAAGLAIHEHIAKSLDTYLSKAEQEAGGYVDGLVAKLDEAREQAIERFEQQAKQVETTCNVDREQMLAKLDEEVGRIKTIAEERIAHAKQVIEEATDGMHVRAASAVDSALRQADVKLEDYEGIAVEHLRVIDDGIEHGIELSKKRISEHEKASRQQGVDALRRAETDVADAQKRLAMFEAAIAQRIGLATQTVNDAVGSIDDRMARVEQDASARVMNIVELAETSGKAVADSIDALALTAEQTAASAQKDLESKLSAFEEIATEALQHAESTLRTNIGELRDTSRSMIEVVSRQVKAQAGEIEPQTREVIAQAEQTLQRRIGELRESAQGMVDIAVSRLQGQLDEVKSKAQHTAFQGIDPQGEQAPEANEAA